MNYILNKSVRVYAILSLTLLTVSCSKNKPDTKNSKLFTLLDEKTTQIDFLNQLEYTAEYNTYTYRNFYNGAGVGIGDFNNDTLPDIYFCGNIADNKLYINKGNFVFEDITEKAGVACPDVWSTGVSIADVNGDGWQDIYVCKSGHPDREHRYNELFINNGDLTFTEKAAEYGIDDFGLSTHASFFDYDKDGDLDCYLLSNSFQSVSEFDIKPGQRKIRDTLGGNKLYRNDDGYFKDVSKKAGIYGSKIGFGLGVSAGDINRDGWIDMYVSNDFFERDYIYINNKDGTFTEALEEQFSEISLGAMGADMADINNDGYPEIYTTEMTAEENSRLKTKVLFESWDKYNKKLEMGYYRQFARNVLQLNNRNNSFSEIGRLSNVNRTDWSWGALIMDLDNDGWKDIFVANGIYKDLLDRDYLDLYSNPSVMRTMIKTEENAILKLIKQIPSVKISNYAFHNNKDLTFTNLAAAWGLDKPSHSNGAAYGDLDNDGDLDLVVNNVNMPSFIYRNEAQDKPESNFLVINLTGSRKNTSAIGSEVTLYYNGQINYKQQIPIRGFKSTVDNRLHFGLGDTKKIDSLQILWPDGKCTILKNIKANSFLNLDQENADKKCSDIKVKRSSPSFTEVKKIDGLNFAHKENDFVDFERNKLLFEMLSNEGPRIAVADVNGDSKDDIFICGAKNSPGALFIQKENGRFQTSGTLLFEADKISEDTDCAFFDANTDGYPDLYVSCGGSEFPATSSALIDRLYINDGQGNFSKSPQTLPVSKYVSSSCVQPADYDKDGDTDIFVGTRLKPFLYGIPVNGYLLENDGQGNFKDVTKEKAPGLIKTGMITDMVWADIDNDDDPDMVVVGDWMPVKIFINDQGTFSERSDQFGLADTEGWWNVITARDLNNDGNIDFILGNHGLNSSFRASTDKPVTMYVNDFDMNGSVEHIICTYNGEKSYPMVMKDVLVNQIPTLKTKYKFFADYKDQTIEDIFPVDVLQRAVKLKANLMESCVLINSGAGSFQINPLPLEAQFSPVYAIVANDFDKDGNCDIIIGGNQYKAKPETGIYSASYGLFLKGNSNGEFNAVQPDKSGFFTKGEIRDLKILNIFGTPVIVVARNNMNLKYFKYNLEL